MPQWWGEEWFCRGGGGGGGECSVMLLPSISGKQLVATSGVLWVKRQTDAQGQIGIGGSGGGGWE